MPACAHRDFENQPAVASSLDFFFFFNSQLHIFKQKISMSPVIVAVLLQCLSRKQLKRTNSIWTQGICNEQSFLRTGLSTDHRKLCFFTDPDQSNLIKDARGYF